jgi:hypothetical protein
MTLWGRSSYPLELASTTSIPGLCLLRLQIAGGSLLLGQGRHVCVCLSGRDIEVMK